MAIAKKPKEKVVAGVCVCGHLPCTVKHKSKYLLACPDGLYCAIRGLWCTNEQEAIKSWNGAVQTARRKAKAT